MNRFLAPVLFLALCAAPATAQQPDTVTLRSTPVLRQALSDAELRDFEVVSSTLLLRPAGVDDRPHRHDADLFGYVLEGAVRNRVSGEDREYRAGEMFYEPRNALHSRLENLSTSEPARILVVSIIKKGRQGYNAETP